MKLGAERLPWPNLTIGGFERKAVLGAIERQMAASTGYNLQKAKTTNSPKRSAEMKLSRKQVQQPTRVLPRLRFTDQKLSSYGGIVLFQALFQKLGLRDRLRACFPTDGSSAYGRALLFLGLVVHILLGHRQLREMAYYRDDPMALRLLGLARWPDVATFSRMLAGIEEKNLDRLRRLSLDLVSERLSGLQPRRVTLDFDGSVLGTSRRAQGTAVGYNRRKKGQRSYYPLFCTVAQTGQVFDFLHRPGNVHDSNGAEAFIRACIQQIRGILPRAIVEIRMDGAFFSNALVSMLNEEGVEFTISVPFEGLALLKQRVEARRRWRRVNEETSCFEMRWKPKSWKRRARFLVIRRIQPVQRKEPLQLDLFVPQVDGYVFKVVVTNKKISPRHVAVFHEGRGAQEAVFGELKSDGQMGYIPVRGLVGNQAYLLATILAHNLSRELQMQVREPQRSTTEKRAPLWRFERLDTLRRRLIQRAGRLTWPQGILTLTFGVGEAIQHDIESSLERLQPASAGAI